MQERTSAFEREVCRLEMALTAQKAQSELLRRKAEECQKSQEHFESLFKSSPAAQVLLSASGLLLEANHAARQMLGMKPNVADVPFTTFLVSGQTTAFLKHLRECNLKKREVRIRVKLKVRDGPARPVQLLTAPFGRHGFGPPIFQIIVCDDSELTSAEARLKRRESEDESFINSIDGVVWEADAQSGQRTYISKQAEKLFGYPVEQWVYWPRFWENHVAAEDRERVLGALQSAIAARQNFKCEYRIIAMDRTLVWVRDCVNIVDEEGRLTLRGICMDIRDRKQVEQELQHAREDLEQRVIQRTTELEKTISEMHSFSYTLSHDLRAPLRSMHGYSEILLENFGDKLGPEGTNYLERIMASARRLDSLILDVLNYSKISQEDLQLGPVNLDILVRRIVEEYPTFQPPNAHVEIQSPLLPVLGHEGFLTQCISNLLSNAVKYVQPGTTPRIRIYTRAAGSKVQVVFEDNGIGISPSDQRRIFEIFQRVHPPQDYEGTGMGLAIVQRATQRMGGQAGVESVPGKGSKFWLEFQGGD
jgi:PAS domain S-box-containing protein